MSQSLLDGLHLDDVLGKFNVYKRYHAIIGNTLSVLWFANFIFIAEEVGYRCADFHLKPKDPGNTLNKSINKAQTISKQSTEDGCRNPAECSEWIYDIPDSFVAEFGLACQDWKRTLVGSVHSVGNMLGVVIVGPLSDRFGRKPLIIITGLVGAILGLARSYATSYWLYVALELFCCYKLKLYAKTLFS